jgi:hypothetical protein
MQKIELLLAGVADISMAKLEAGLVGEARRVAGALPAARCGLALRLPGNPVGETAHSSATSDGPRPCDAILEIQLAAAEIAAAIEAIRGLAGRLGHLIDPVRSAAIAGFEHVIMPGRGPVSLCFALRRLPRLTRQQYLDYWLNVHAEFGRHISPTHTYRQFHADDHSSRQTADAAGICIADYDGTAESFFPDVAGLRALLTRTDVAEGALEDERRFIDHARSVIGFYEARWGTLI